MKVRTQTKTQLIDHSSKVQRTLVSTDILFPPVIKNKGIFVEDFFMKEGKVKKRLTPLINIDDGDGFIWSGTFDELIEKLK